MVETVVGIFIYYGFSLATNCFFIYVLRDVEVQDWLLMRSLGGQGGTSSIIPFSAVVWVHLMRPKWLPRAAKQ